MHHARRPSAGLHRNFTVPQTVTDPLTGQPIVINVPVSITNPLVLPGTQVDAQNGVFAYGWTLGLGVDFCLMQNLFLRAEWEWVQFAPIKDMQCPHQYGARGRRDEILQAPAFDARYPSGKRA